MENKHEIVIVGAGFGGLHVARRLGLEGARVTVIDRQNHHLFQPLLYQVATGALSPANIAAPIRSVLKRRRNTETLMAEVVDFDLDKQEVVFSDGRIPYDTLIVAAGMETSYFGNTQWRQLAPGLKSINDAVAIRERIFIAFEKAEREAREIRDEGRDDTRRRNDPDNPDSPLAMLTFVVVGGGPTGVELAGALAEIAHDTLRRDFTSIEPGHARVILVEHHDRLLPPFHPSLSEATRKTLEKSGVQVRTGARVEQITPESVLIQTGDREETIFTHTVLWAAGVHASPLGQRLAGAAGIETVRQGRVPVEQDLSLQGHPDVFVIGDMAASHDAQGNLLPGVAQVAIQQGNYVAGLVKKRLSGRAEPKPFRYSDHGIMATIGRLKAVVEVGRLRVTGVCAWMMWLFIHLIFLVRFQNRLLVMIQWAGNFISWNRPARVITGDDLLPFFDTREDEEPTGP